MSNEREQTLRISVLPDSIVLLVVRIARIGTMWYG